MKAKIGQLELYFLGTFKAQVNDSQLSDFKYNKVRGMLAYLAIEKNRPHRRETLASLFWPEQAESFH